eukprot:1161073-Pelagomonas_calceolata.AAC.7
MRTHHTYFGVALGFVPGWWDGRKRNKNYEGSENTPHINKKKEATLAEKVQQAEKEDGSSNEKESRMIARRLEFQTFYNKQSQHCQPSNQGKPCPAAKCQALLKPAY